MTTAGRRCPAPSKGRPQRDIPAPDPVEKSRHRIPKRTLFTLTNNEWSCECDIAMRFQSRSGLTVGTRHIHALKEYNICQ